MKDPFVEVLIDGQPVDVDTSAVPVSVTMALEEEDDFQTKKGSEALDITTPLTLRNSKLTNSLISLSSRDMTAGEVYENPRSGVIRAHGRELLNGKAILKSANRKKATWHFYGDNSAWAIDLKDKTLDLFVNQNPFLFNHYTIIQSWNFDGTSETNDYVFAPVRYSYPFGSNSAEYSGKDQVVTIYDLKPSLSIYWIITRAFKSVGYQIKSQFFNSEYFKRLVLPWTWGNFLGLNDSVYDQYKFSANTPEVERNTGDCYLYHVNTARYLNLAVSNDSTEGMFDNSGTYEFLNEVCRWRYPSSASSRIVVGLSVSIFYDWSVNWGSYVDLHVHWFKNGALIKDEQVMRVASGDLGGSQKGTGEQQMFFETEVMPGDFIDVKFLMDMHDSGVGRAIAGQFITQYKLDYFKLSLNSSVQLNQYGKLKNYRFLDLFRGLIDLFNLIFRTDSKRKVVTIEPLYSYTLTNDFSAKKDGYIRFFPEDWTGKQDLEEEDVVELYSDAEREWHYKFKDDASDGALKKMQDRYQVTIGLGKYILPERFDQSEPKEVENRFFSPLMHMQGLMFAGVTGITPQLPCIFPENISNTSATESDNTFQPKIAYYKGNVSGVGGWKFLNAGDVVNNYTTLPFLFSVNYQPGGENDPVLSYSDQNINGVIGYGLLRRFFLQRMAIYRHGRKWNPAFRLTLCDVEKPFGRTKKVGDDQYILTEITEYTALEESSTKTVMWRFTPIEQKDLKAIFPTVSSVLSDVVEENPFDFKHVKHLILYSDLPK